jgi:hypothetical protein
MGNFVLHLFTLFGSVANLGSSCILLRSVLRADDLQLVASLLLSSIVSSHLWEQAVRTHFVEYAF